MKILDGDKKRKEVSVFNWIENVERFWESVGRLPEYHQSLVAKRDWREREVQVERPLRKRNRRAEILEPICTDIFLECGNGCNLKTDACVQARVQGHKCVSDCMCCFSVLQQSNVKT